MDESNKAKGLGRGLLLSALAHGLIVGFMVLFSEKPVFEVEFEETVDWLDVEIVPSDPAVDFNSIPDPKAPEELSDQSPPEVKPSPTAITIRVDAGVERRPDAGPSDAGPMDGGHGDGGPEELASADAGPADAGPPATPDAGVIPPAGNKADFSKSTAGGDVISVLMRFDRIRGTPWVPYTEAIMKPMPDSQMIIGTRSASMTDILDSIFIASPRPRDPTATTVIGKFSMPETEMRAFINRPGFPVKWSASEGGALGTPPANHASIDPRVYLIPHEGWIVLTNRRYLAGLDKPMQGAALVPRGETAKGPDWVKKIPSIPEQAGEPTGPFAVVTAQGLRGRMVLPPLMGADDLPIPKRLTFGLEVSGTGFVVKGALFFDDLATASKFVSDGQKVFSGTALRFVAAGFGAGSAIKNLKMERRGTEVVFSSRMSSGDAKVMLGEVAKWSKRYFEARRPRPRRAPRPKPPVRGPTLPR